MAVDDDLIPATLAADIIGVSRTTVVSMLEDGRLTGRVGRAGTRPRYHVERAAAEALRDQGRNRPHANARVPATPIVPEAAVSSVRGLAAEDQPPDAWRERTRDDLQERIQHLEAENRRLRLVAQRANSALTLQTEALQQYLITDRVPDH